MSEIKTYSNNIKRIPRDAVSINGAAITTTETDTKLSNEIERQGISLLTTLIRMFPKEAKQKVRELDVPT